MKEDVFEVLASIHNYISFLEPNDTIGTLKIISYIITPLLAITVIYLVFRISKEFKGYLLAIAQGPEGDVKQPLAKVADKQWQTVLDKLNSLDENNYKLAIIEADTLFDNFLKSKGYVGADMGERLKQIDPKQFANLDEIWQVHKLRNQIAHEPNIKVSLPQARRAMEIYQEAMRDLE